MINNAILFKDAEELKALVDANDFLRQVYKDDDSLQFPSIIVLGEQSHGKTSLIENITNLNLPRGTGIQTRVPTEIRLRNGPVNVYRITYRPHKEQEHKTIDFNELNLEEIMRKVQLEVTGSDCMITDDLIVLHIERPDLLPLTFVDLPGYICQSTDQIKVDVEEILRKIYVRYIAHPTNRLLVVMNAANDIENSKIIKLCRKHDPLCERVMVCANKIDLRPSFGFDNYTKACEQFGIKRIFFVRNKTEDERKENRQLEFVREIERAFISKHPELSKFDKSQLGILSLRNYLVQMQKENIVPAIKSNYQKVIEILSRRRTEQFDIIRYSLEPPEFLHFVRHSLDKVLAEIEQTFKEHDKAFHKTNFYRNVHDSDSRGQFEARFPAMNTQVAYTVSDVGGQTEISFSCSSNHLFHAEVVVDKTITHVLRVEAVRASVAKVPQGRFVVSVWLMHDFDYFTYLTKIKNLFSFFKTQYSFDHFLSPNFATTYEQHELLHVVEESMEADLSDSMAREILARQIIPKFVCEVEDFVTFAKDFIQGLFLTKVTAVFREYPFVSLEIHNHIKLYFAELYRTLDTVFEVFLENLYENNFTNRNDRFMFEFIQSMYKDQPSDKVKAMLAHLTGGDSFSDQLEASQCPKRVFDCGLRLFITITYKFQYFTENLVNTIRNRLIMGSVRQLKKVLFDMLHEPKFKDEEELRLLMRPNEELYSKQVFLKNEIQKAEVAIEKMKSLREKFPQFRTEFEYIDKMEAVKLENLDVGLRNKIIRFLNESK